MSVGGAGTHGNSFAKGSTSDEAAGSLIGIAQQFANETTPLRQNLISTFNEILTTGGSRLPIFAQAEEQTRQAASKATESTEQDLARQGLSGSPFGAQVLAGTKQQGEQAAASTRQNIIMQLLGQIQPFVLGQSGTAASGLSGAMGGNTKSKGQGFGISTSVAGGKSK